MTRKILASIATALLCLNCSSSSDGGSSGNTNTKTGPSGIEGAHGSCTGLGDCSGGDICLAARDGGACVPTCTINGNECSGTATCNQVGTVSVNVCKKEPQSGSGGDSGSTEADEVYVPCTSDAECQAVEAGAICAADSYGDKQCTSPCSTESDCDVPGYAGYSVDFFSCQVDQADTTRHACLFDPKCENDPLSCTTGFNPGTGGTPGTGTGGADGSGGDLGTGNVPGVGGFPF